MNAPEDIFELALHVDACLLATERRATAVLVHPAVDANETGVVIANTFNFRRTPIPAALPLYERVQHLAERIGRLSSERREELGSALVRDRKRTPWRPMRGAQAELFECDTDVILAAGGAGSGKTEGVAGKAITQHAVARFLRGTSLEFGPILKRIGELVGSTDGRNLSTQSWQLPPPFGFNGEGLALEFTGLADEGAMLKLQGRPVDLLVVDDAASGAISKESIEFASRWLRSTDARIARRLILTANPPTSSDALWIRDEWFAPWLSPSYAGPPAKSGEKRYFLNGVEVPVGTPGAESRCVIMSTVRDNPLLMRTGYLEHLKRAPSAELVARLADNDWTVGFDQDDAMQVIPSAWVELAMERWAPTPPAGVAMSTAGVDVARGGKDRTTIALRYDDDYFASLRVYPGSATPDGQATAALVLAARGPNAHVFIDAGGIGAAPFDLLKERIPGKVTAINFGASSGRQRDVTQSFEFANVRSLLWWRLREALDPASGRRIALPPDRALKSELTMPRYELRSGRLYVESRDDIIKRLHRSPDLATSVVLALIPTNSTLAYVDSFTLALQRNNQRWAELQRNRTPEETTA